MKKKKLKKELKRFISDKIIDVSFINLEPLKNEHNDYYYDLKVYVEKELSKDELLEKANRDYDFGYIVKCMDDGKEKVINSINPVFCSNGIWLNEDVFIYKNGKWAEVLKKPLMLGEHEVKIDYLYDFDGVPCDEIIIKANGGQVTEDEWMEWQKIFVPVIKSGGHINLNLGKYAAFNTVTSGITICSIKNVTIEQIQAITDKLNEL